MLVAIVALMMLAMPARADVLIDLCSSLGQTDMETTADFIIYGDSTERVNPLIAVIERSYRRGDIGILELRALCQSPESFWKRLKLSDAQAVAVIAFELPCIMNNTRRPALKDRLYWMDPIQVGHMEGKPLACGLGFADGHVRGIVVSWEW